MACPTDIPHLVFSFCIIVGLPFLTDKTLIQLLIRIPFQEQNQ
jgi:hypothetical protein